MHKQPTADTVSQHSLWVATEEMPTYAPLQENIRADVCIVGAGIAGLSTAYMLTKAGKSVVVLDDGHLADGMTAVTTAHLSNALDDRYFEIERLHGELGARRAAESHTAAINSIEAIVRDEQIDCDFERLDGYLFLSPGDREEMLDRELAAAHRAGLREVAKLSSAPLQSFNTGPCLRFPSQAQFHPLKYLAAIAKAIVRDGGRIFAQSHADKITGGCPARVKVGPLVVTADAVVVATNSPVNDVLVIHTKQAPYMTYVIGARVPRGSVAKALYWDTQDPYHYVRLQSVSPGASSAVEHHGNGQSEYEILIVGGEDHKTGQADDSHAPYARLEAWARQRFPAIEQVEFTWSGQVMETIDGLAFIGRNPLDEKNVYIITGDSGMGMTHGTIAGLLLTDLILDRENPWETLYDPSRKTLQAASTFVSEILNVAVQYTDWLTPGDVEADSDVPNDSGAVLRRGMTKVAAYRDENGTLHQCSAICNHLGCIVDWNSTEKTWDCPCHGSRFNKLGEVISGPANQNLTPIDAPETGM